VATGKNNIEWYQQNFDLLEKSLNGGSTTRLHSARKQAMKRFSDLGFPTLRDEEWRFTNVTPITKVPFTPVLREDQESAGADDVRKYSYAELQSIQLVFVDGHFRKDLSSLSNAGERIVISDLGSIISSEGNPALEALTRDALAGYDALTALNTAFLQDGAFISVPKGVTLEVPIHLLYLASRRNQPFLSSPRNLILAGPDSRVSIVETYAGLTDNLYFTNAVSDIVLSEGATVEHDKLQIESENAYHIGAIYIRQHARSSYTANSISLGGSIVRNTVVAVLEEEHSECTLNGLALGTGKQLVDNHTVIDHASPNCSSHELYKSVLDGRAKGVFNGKIFVRKDAQKTDAKQTNKTLLLSDEATIDTKPQLEIFADDVKCTHGATVGQLDDEQVFYLRSRGVGLDDARDILTYAFASDIIRRVHVQPLREQLEGMIQARLNRGRIQGLETE